MRDFTIALRLGAQCAGVLCLGLLGSPAFAQFQQYTNPGGDFEETRETMQERLDRSMKEARWRLGRFFIDPWVGIRNVAYIDNVTGASQGETQSDFTATLGAGLRFYRPLGSETVFASYALPEYVWWKDLAGRRRINGRYGAGFFGNLGRTGFELSATRTEDATFFSAELEEPINTVSELANARIEVELFGGLALFAGGTLQRYDFPGNEDTPFEVELLARDEEILRGGIRFPRIGGLEMGLGLEESTVEFDSRIRDRSNSGTAPILELDFRGSALTFSARLASRDLKPETGATFPLYDDVTGTLRAAFRPTGRTEFQLYSDRNLVYSLNSDWDYYQNTRYGLAIQTSLSSLASLRVYVSTGSLEYASSSASVAFRQDDFDTLGGDLRIRLGSLELVIGFRETEYDSNLSGFDRSVTVIRSGLTFGPGSGSAWG